ncbi:MAG: alpha/beta hydrolase [Verrucomicrobia bacterium]|nr:alpha/beta hydrolase [Verrucomicrobiota bacterium]
MTVQTLDLEPGLTVSFLGPDLRAGPLPTLFYFSLSAVDSLTLDPFNQPVAYLSALPMRIFSLTIPGHEDNLPPTEALYRWANQMARGEPVIEPFLEQIARAVSILEEKNLLLPEKTAVAGLSRGAFIAALAAAKIPAFRWILGFAPLTQLAFAKEFEGLKELPSVQALSLENVINTLTDRSVRFYIGNMDTRVGTRRCFDFIEKLSHAAFEKRIRSPQVELIITPSIGFQGHGTSKETFHAGAQWIAEKLGAIDVL